MAEAFQHSPRTDKNQSISNRAGRCSSSSKSEKSRTFSNGDAIKRSQLNANDDDTEKPTKSNSARGSAHEDSVGRGASKDGPHESETNVRLSNRSNSADDQLSKTVQNISRSSMSKSQSLNEEGLRAKRNGGTDPRKTDIHGFVLVSWKIRQFSQLEKALRQGL